MTKSSIFPQRLKELRLKMEFTQKELGEKVGVKQNTFTNWERGTREPSFENLINLSLTLKTSIDYLLGLTDNPKIKLTEQDFEQLSKEEVLEIAKRDYDRLTLLFLSIIIESNGEITVNDLLKTPIDGLEPNDYRNHIFNALTLWETKYKKIFQKNNGNNSETTNTK